MPEFFILQKNSRKLSFTNTVVNESGHGSLLVCLEFRYVKLKKPEEATREFTRETSRSIAVQCSRGSEDWFSSTYLPISRRAACCSSTIARLLTYMELPGP